MPVPSYSAKWLLAHLWAGKKEKHHRKASPKEGEEDARNKQVKAVVESFQRSAVDSGHTIQLRGVHVCDMCCLPPSFFGPLAPFRSLLEKQGIDFTKTQEEELEKEFEEMRVRWVHAWC